MDFLGKNILITGGSRGIGLAICNIFKSLGGNVISLNSKDCDFTKDNIKESLGKLEIKDVKKAEYMIS